MRQCPRCSHTHDQFRSCASCVEEFRTVYQIGAQRRTLIEAKMLKRLHECAKLWTRTGADDGGGFQAYDLTTVLQALREHEEVLEEIKQAKKEYRPRG